MQTIKLKEDFYWTGIIDENLRVFDIIMYTEFGTTYNSYVLKAGDKTVLFETAKAKFFDDYLRELKKITDIEKIDYLIVDHTEPDHAGSVELLLEINPNMKIIATSCAVNFLKNIVNRDFYSIQVKDNEVMKIGDKTLRFMTVPNLHWPDTMYTWIEEDKILVTCDSFGAHYGVEDVLRSRIKNEEDYKKAVRYYFDCIIGPFKGFMLKALHRVKELSPVMICTGHGPVLDTKIDEIFEMYEEWCTVKNPNSKKTVIIPFVSAYGYTMELAEKIAEGIRASGPVEVRTYDMVSADLTKVVGELEFADGILFGTPTIVGEALKPIWDVTTSIFPATHGGKYASAFGSYGWSGEGVPHIIDRLRQLKMKVPDDGFRVKFKPDEVALMDAYEYGYRFGCLVLGKEGTGKKNSDSGVAAGPRKLVKCLVCGEIFDSSMDTCPVCGVGREYFVYVDEQDTGFRNDTEDFYVIIGNGIAGLSAAEEIRRRNKTASVVMISNEPYDTYNRPMLTKSMLAGLTPEQTAVHEAGWYEKNNIIRVLGRRVSSVDTDIKQIMLEDGSKMVYTKLIYALGAECAIPPIKGVQLDNVIAVRRLEDIRRIERLLPEIKSVCVIGGGVLGLEAAWEFRKSGREVTVLEAAPSLMMRQIDKGASDLLLDIAAKEKIQIYTGVQAEEILPGAKGVRIADGKTLPADLVIISAGIRPNTALAMEAGLAVDRAVVVNEKMETNVKDVYACGDCAQYQGMNYALWGEASAQGKTAGANAAGEDTEYEPPSMGLSFHGMNTALYAIGDTGKVKELSYRTEERKDEARKQYEKYYYANGQLKGAILMGDLTKMAEVTEKVK